VGVQTIIIRRTLIAITLAAIGLMVLFRPYIPSLPYKVGNVVQAGGLLGVVEATTFLNTRLKAFDGKTVFILNSKILNDNVINYHFTPNRQIRLSVLIDYKEEGLPHSVREAD
jgi:small conductance mechanosensitive channel